MTARATLIWLREEADERLLRRTYAAAIAYEARPAVVAAYLLLGVDIDAAEWLAHVLCERMADDWTEGRVSLC